MNCCEQRKIASVVAKCSDLCVVTLPDGTSKNGYVPYEINIGGGDYVRFSYCMHCGKMSGTFPIKNEEDEKDIDLENDEEFE